jgi:protein phosphatase 2C
MYIYIYIYLTFYFILFFSAFGDFPFSPAVGSSPYVMFHRVRENDLFVIVASDGVWDVLTDTMAVQVVWKTCFGVIDNLDVNLAAAALRTTAFALGSGDDISVIVLRLDHHN